VQHIQYILFTHYYPRESEGVCFTGVGLCVCLCVSLSVTMITKKIADGFVPHFGKVSKGKGETKFVLSYDRWKDALSNGQKTP